MKRRFEDRVILITGGTSGMGRQAAMQFSMEGASVVVCGRNEKNGHHTVEEINEKGGKAIYFCCDVSRSEEVENLIDFTVSRFNKLDCAINNAGVMCEHAMFADSTESNWDHVVGINLKGVYLSMKYEIKQMLKNGGGAIVNVSSVAGISSYPGISAYNASKFGVHGLTKTAALEYAREEAVIRVNAVAPAFIYSGSSGKKSLDNSDIRKKRESILPMGRLGNANEVADAILWLCSDEASFITGSILPLDGGFLAGFNKSFL